MTQGKIEKTERMSGLRLLIALLACVIALVLLNLTVRIEAHSLPKVSEILASTGLNAEQDQEFSDRQKFLIEKIMEYYEKDDDLHDQERAMLAQVGTSLPSADEKAQLQRMFMDHFKQWRDLNKLVKELTEENERLKAAKTTN